MNLSTSLAIEEAFKLGMHQRDWEIRQLCLYLEAHGPLNHVIEIGSDKGGSYHVWQAISTGLVVSVDLPGGPWGSKCDLEERNARWHRDYGVRSLSLLGNSQDLNHRGHVAKVLGGHARADLLFLDGDHSYAGVYADFNLWAPLVRPGGWVVFHDVNETPYQMAQGCYVHGFWKQLRGRKVTISEGGEWGGLGVYEVPL